MRKSWLGACLAVVLIATASGPAEARTRGEAPYDFILDDAEMTFRVGDVQPYSAAVTWDPAAFSYGNGALPASCDIQTYNRVTDAQPTVFFGKTVYFPAATTTVQPTGTGLRTDRVALVPGQSSHISFVCRTPFTMVENGQEVALEAGGRWDQTARITSADVAPLTPTFDAIQRKDASTIRFSVMAHIAGVEGATKAEIRRYDGDRLASTSAEDLSTTTSAGWLPDRFSMISERGVMPNGTYSYAVRMGNSRGWSPWSARSAAVSITGSTYTPVPASAKRGGGGAVNAFITFRHASVSHGRMRVTWRSSEVRAVRIAVTRSGSRVRTIVLGAKARAASIRLPYRGRYRVTIRATFRGGGTGTTWTTVQR